MILAEKLLPTAILAEKSIWRLPTLYQIVTREGDEDEALIRGEDNFTSYFSPSTDGGKQGP